jgi:hypothetical protein
LELLSQVEIAAGPYAIACEAASEASSGVRIILGGTHECGNQKRSDGKESYVKKTSSKTAEPPSRLIDARIEELDDWRGRTLSRVRAVIKQADPEVVEEWKWVKATNPGTPVWSHNGGICTGETYKRVVKLTFFKGAALEDPSGLFNSSLGGKVRRAIDFHEGDEIDETALKNLIREAVTLNTSSARGPAR